MLEPGDLHDMTKAVLERAAGAASVVVVLEGGYARARTAAGVVATIRALAGLPVSD